MALWLVCPADKPYQYAPAAAQVCLLLVFGRQNRLAGDPRGLGQDKTVPCRLKQKICQPETAQADLPPACCHWETLFRPTVEWSRQSLRSAPRNTEASSGQSCRPELCRVRSPREPCSF